MTVIHQEINETNEARDTLHDVKYVLRSRRVFLTCVEAPRPSPGDKDSRPSAALH